MSKKKSFLMYHDFSAVLDELTDSEAGELFKAIYHFQLTGEKKVVSLQLKLILTSLVSQFERDKASYAETCASRSEAGRLGGLAKANKAKQMKQELAKLANLADSDNDSESDSENDSKKKTKGKDVFVPPTIKDASNHIAEFAESKRLIIDSLQRGLLAEEFVEHYTNCDWKLNSGKGAKMRKWELALNKFIRGNFKSGQYKRSK